MFCKNCGNEIAEDALFCPKCGKKLIEAAQTNNNSGHETEAILGFVLGLASLFFGLTLIIPILGIYFSSKGKNSSKESLAKAGKVISIITLIFSILAIVIYITAIIFTFKTTKDVLSEESNTEEITYAEGVLDWYKSSDFWFIIQTNEKNSAIVNVDVVLGYQKNDKTALTEIKQKEIQIADSIRNFFAHKTGHELKIKDEEILKTEIRDLINNKILTSSKIKDVRFSKFDVTQF